MGLGKVNFLVPGLDIPLPPGSNDLHIGSKPLDCQFKPNLIVALAGSTVADGIRALSQRDFSQFLADNRTGKGSSQQVSLILGVHFQGGDDDLVHHLIHQIGHNQLAGTGGDGLGLQALQLVGLTHVAGHGNDFGIIVVLLQPGDNDGSIQTAGIRQNDLLNRILVIHIYSLHMNNIHIYVSNNTGIILPVKTFVNVIFPLFSPSGSFRNYARIWLDAPPVYR